jgi:hypothetical protein
MSLGTAAVGHRLIHARLLLPGLLGHPSQLVAPPSKKGLQLHNRKPAMRHSPYHNQSQLRGSIAPARVGVGVDLRQFADERTSPPKDRPKLHLKLG